MKKITLTLIAVLLFAAETIKAQEQVLNASEPISSGCLSRNSGEDTQALPTIKLTKEGSVLSVELFNYESNCATGGFEVGNRISGGNYDTPYSVVISVAPVLVGEMDCYCPFNISYTVRDIEKNKFHLTCWWFDGLVELTEGEPLVLEYKTEDVVIDSLRYLLLKTSHQAKLLSQDTKVEILQIPSEIEYEGEEYTVTSINRSFASKNTSIKRIIIPKTVKNTEFGSNEGISNSPFISCLSLETIEVEEGNPAICSIDGVLFNKDKTTLIGYPAASPRELYTVPDYVKTAAGAAFRYSQHLKKVVFPDNMEALGSYLFGNSQSLEEVILPSNIKELPRYLFMDCKKLNSVVIPTTSVPNTHEFAFKDVDLSKVTLHVPATSIDAYQSTSPWNQFGAIVPLLSQLAYRPFVEDGKVWMVGGSDSGNPVKLVKYYYFDGETIIDGKTCKQMLCQQFVSPDYAESHSISNIASLSYVGAWYEEDKKVFKYDSAKKQFQIMYDFSLETNDTVWINYQPYVLGPRQTGGIKGFKGVYRDVFIGEDFYNITWLEGVGSIEGPTFNVYYGKEYHGGAFLMSCIVGDEVIYLNDEYEDGATPDIDKNVRKRRFDFTHTVKTKPKAPIKQEGSDARISSSEREVARPEVKAPIKQEGSDARISSSEREVARPEVKARTRSEVEPSLYGEYNDLILGINLDPLDDTYQVRITDELGKVVYEKTINASNILGLKINIADYAKGLYTVTMENSREAFIGEFVAKTTGIEEVESMRSETRDGIFDLQGRRLLSKPKKGIYIENGRKRVVQ